MFIIFPCKWRLSPFMYYNCLFFLSKFVDYLTSQYEQCFLSINNISLADYQALIICSNCHRPDTNIHFIFFNNSARSHPSILLSFMKSLVLFVNPAFDTIRKCSSRSLLYQSTRMRLSSNFLI